MGMRCESIVSDIYLKRLPEYRRWGASLLHRKLEKGGMYELHHANNSEHREPSIAEQKNEASAFRLQSLAMRINVIISLDAENQTEQE